MKKQDKYDCRKIKEMIMNNDLSISALSELHLNTLIAYEAECLMASLTYTDTKGNRLQNYPPKYYWYTHQK